MAIDFRPGPNPRPLRVELLGPVRLTLGERPLPDDAWPRRSSRALLLLLLATPGHALRRDRLLDLLWPEATPDAARNALYVALHGLRRVCQPDLGRGRHSAYIETGGQEIRLLPHPGFWVDVDAFERALAAAAAAPASERTGHLRDALALYSGDLLSDEVTVDWVIPRREALRAA